MIESQFEFETLQHARNYRRAICDVFKPYLQGRILEVGVGVGNITGEYIDWPQVRSVFAIEPEKKYHQFFGKQFPLIPVVHGTVFSISEQEAFDSILSINVLEHIEDDLKELQRYHQHLLKNKGALCLFVPAHRELYSSIDKEFGHFRRYTKKELIHRLQKAGFKIEKISYFNWIGYFAWLFYFCIFNKKKFNKNLVILFDKIIFPCTNFFERILPPFFGQNLIAVCRA